MLTAAGANAGVLKGLPCLFGVTTGMGLMMFLVPLGLGSLVLEHPLVLRALHWGGAAFLLWLSWKIATSGRMESMPEGKPVGYLGAAVFQWVNPKSWLVSASAAGTFLSAGGGEPRRAVRLPRRALLPGGIAELLHMAGVRSHGPARPPQQTPGESIQHRNGGAPCPLDCSHHRVARARRPTRIYSFGSSASASGPPALILPDAAGRLVSLADDRGKKPVVVVFYRGYW